MRYSSSIMHFLFSQVVRLPPSTSVDFHSLLRLSDSMNNAREVRQSAAKARRPGAEERTGDVDASGL